MINRYCKNDFMRLLGMVIFVSILFILISVRLSRGASSTATLTNNNTDNSTFLGCAACPVTNVPISMSTPGVEVLPVLVRASLTPDNQFGNGVPAGSEANQIHLNPTLLPSVITNFSYSNSFDTNPKDISNNRTHTGQTNMNYTVASGSASGQNQTDSFLFNFNSTTDAQGNLVGNATGTFTQTVRQDNFNVVNMTGSFVYNLSSGLILTINP